MTDASEKLNVRPAVASDLAALADFIQPFVQNSRLLPRTMDELGELLGNAFLAECDGQIVGCAALEVYSQKLAEVRSLAVSSESRGRGVGRLLVDACVERARSLRVLEVMAITSEEDFFRACGFDFTLPGEKKALFVQTRENVTDDPPA